MERPKEFGFQFPILFGFDVFAIQPNLITGGIAFRLDAFIVGLFLKLLSMLEFFTANDH